MKKLITTFMISFFFVLGYINAQSNLDLKLFKDIEKMIHVSKSVAERGGKFLLQKKVYDSFNVFGKTIGKGQLKFEYNLNGLEILRYSESYDSLTQIWINSGSNYISTYDAKNNLETERDEFFDDFDNKWYKSYKTIYSYDSLNQLVTSKTLRYQKGKQDSAYLEIFTTNTYDVVGKILSVLEKEQYKNTNPLNENYKMAIYHYDANDNNDFINFYTGDSLSVLSASEEHNFFYDSNHNMIKSEQYKVVNKIKNQSPEYIYTFKYDNKNLNTYISLEQGNPLIEIGRVYYSYDSDGKLKNEKFYSYEIFFKTLFYYYNVDYFYSQFVDTKDIQTISFSIYPNPSSDMILIKTNEVISSSSIYDINGRLLSITNGNFPNINIADLSNGTYFLQVSTVSGMGTTKFIKK